MPRDATPLIAALAATAALAGCSGTPQTPAGNATANVESTEINQAGAETPAADPGANASVATGRIPDAIRGRWGLVPADCTSTAGDNKGLLTIDATTLRFYESRGTVAKVVEQSPMHLVADLAMSGEGQDWTRRTTLDVQDGGKVLVRSESGGGDALTEPLRYQRCG